MTRLKQAMEHNEVSLQSGVIDTIAKRAKTDGQLDRIAHALLDVLEPPYCQMSHCEHHTAYAFCGCSKKRVPGHCPIHRGYIKRQQVKREKIKLQLIEMIASDRNLSRENVADRLDFDKYVANAGGISKVINHYQNSKQA